MDLEAALRKVATLRVAFAHQSVGNDILAGVRTLSQETQVPITIIETRAPEPDRPGIFHYTVGRNTEPDLKMNDFAGTTAAVPADVAVLKLCYVDVDAKTQPQALADRYIATLESLQRNNPATRYVAVTVPVTTVQSGPRAWVKKAMGRAPAGYAENARRQLVNERLRAHFKDGRLFDLAQFEATAGAGDRRVRYEGRTVDVLDAGLSSDGGHLNERGQRALAEQFVRFLANQPARS